jgi:hypothetical protein
MLMGFSIINQPAIGDTPVYGVLGVPGQPGDEAKGNVASGEGKEAAAFCGSERKNVRSVLLMYL